MSGPLPQVRQDQGSSPSLISSTSDDEAERNIPLASIQIEKVQQSSKYDTVDSPHGDDHEQLTPPTVRARRGSLIPTLSSEHIEFQFNVFIPIFLYHVFFPFSIPFVLLLEGFTFALNLCFILNCKENRLITFAHQIGGALFFFGLITLAVIRPESSKVTNLEIGIGLACFIGHKLVIGTKYALMTEEQLRILHTRQLDQDHATKIELIGGWSEPSINILDEQLNRSAKRLGVDLKNLYFETTPKGSPCAQEDQKNHEERTQMHTQHQHQHGMSNGNSGNSGNSSKHILKTPRMSSKKSKQIQHSEEHETIKEFYSDQLHRDAVSTNADGTKYIAVYSAPLAVKVFREILISFPRAHAGLVYSRTIALIQCLLLPILRISFGQPFSGTYEPLDIVICVVSIGQTFYWYSVLHIFISVGVSDYFRRWMILAVLGRMIDPTPCGSETYTYLPPDLKRPVFVDLMIPSNIAAWISFREVLMDIGFQYRERLTLYTSYLLLIALGLAFTLLYQLLAGVPADIFYVAFVVLNIVGILIPLIMMVYYGMRANNLFSVHKGLLVRIRFTIRELNMNDIIQGQSTKRNRHQFIGNKEEREACDALLDGALQILHVEEQINPIRILGLRASDAMIKSMASVLAGAAGIGIKLLDGGRY